MSEGMKDESELVTQAWRGTERRMYPEVSKFLSEYRFVQWALEDAVSAAQYEQDRAERAARREAEAEGRTFDTYNNEADRVRRTEWRQVARDATTAARDAFSARKAELLPLLTESTHPEVAWIGKEIVAKHDWAGEIGEYARDILAILPATTEEIWEEAKNNRGMCDVFDRFYDQAEAAGVFNINGSSVAAREIAALRSWVRRTLGGSYVAHLMPHVDRIIKAVQEEADERLTEAKAEWQRLDEARAQNATFNRSQAQKARYERERAALEAKAVVEDDAPDAPRVNLTRTITSNGAVRVSTVSA